MSFLGWGVGGGGLKHKSAYMCVIIQHKLILYIMKWENGACADLFHNQFVADSNISNDWLIVCKNYGKWFHLWNRGKKSHMNICILLTGIIWRIFDNWHFWLFFYASFDVFLTGIISSIFDRHHLTYFSVNLMCFSCIGITNLCLLRQFPLNSIPCSVFISQ